MRRGEQKQHADRQGTSPVNKEAPPLDETETYVDGQTYYVDFDHTLFLKNSTEAFLDSARPAFLVAPLLKILGALQPWRLLPGGASQWRDMVRVLMVLVLTPWTLLLFYGRAKSLFTKHLNKELDRKLANVPADRIVIASFGLRFVIRALIKNSRYAEARLVAPSLFGLPGTKKNGKLDLLKQEDLLPDADKDVFYTDNPVDDADIIEHVAQSHIAQWDENDETGAFHNSYLPLFYTAKIKRSPRFLVRQVLLEEMPIIMLAFGLFLPGPPLAILGTICGIGLLFLSFHTIYEIGYADNDKTGLKNEINPKLSENFFKYPDYKLQPFAWIWSFLLAFAAISIMTPAHIQGISTLFASDAIANPWLQKLTLAAVWMLVPISALFCFLAFNRSSLRLRVFVYLPLHALKYFGPAVFFVLNPISLALIVAQIIRTWSLYLVRRANGNTDWVLSQMIRLCFFAGFVGIFFILPETRSLTMQWQSWVLLTFCVLRAIPEYRSKMNHSDEPSEI